MHKDKSIANAQNTDNKPFPSNQEPRGATRFGPDPMKPRPTTQNANNTDKAGKAQPWRDPANRL